jgi:cytochrome c2
MNIVMRVLGIAGLLVVVRASAAAQDPARGKEIFQSACAACHTIGDGRLAGPDLQGVHERRSEAWIIAFVQHPQQVISSGDSVAAALLEEYQGLEMPDQSLTADEIRHVLAHIRRGASGTTPLTAMAPAAPTAEQVQLGRELFEGRARFANGGPACQACHEVRSEAVIGGGSLARDLTTAFTRLSGAGVQAVVRAPPFPVMQRAYQDKPLVEAEVMALTGFLRHIGEQPAQHPPGFAPRLVGVGFAGTVLLLLLYALVWSKRSKGSVYQRIFDRQIKST